MIDFSVDQLVFEALDSEIPEKEYYAFTGSNLPYCARREALFVLDRALDELPNRKQPVKWSMAAEVGTAMHTVIQSALGHMGVLFGNWLCGRCSKKIEMTTGPHMCCGRWMAYDEIYINDPHTNYRGKVDAILVKNGIVKVVDFKTKANKKAMKVDTGHIFQAVSYKYYLSMAPYLLNIDEVGILYLTRAEKPDAMYHKIEDADRYVALFEVDRYWATQVKPYIQENKVQELPKVCRQIGDNPFCSQSKKCFSHDFDKDIKTSVERYLCKK